jgi:molybdopterin converting factor small subunit
MAKVLLFGQIAEIVGTRELYLEAGDTQSLTAALCEQYPALHKAVFALAVNKVTIHSNTPLAENDEVALLPPYSGG